MLLDSNYPPLRISVQSPFAAYIEHITCALMVRLDGIQI